MRRLLLAVGTALSLAACGAVEPAARSGKAPATPAPTQVHRGAVGDAITLTGDGANGYGELRIEVRVDRILQRATGRDVYARPRRGERFVAARFVLKNVGDATYRDSPTYGAKLIDTSGRNYDPTVVAVSAGPAFGKVVKLRPGQARSGYIVFAVPKRARVGAIQYALNAGSDGELGEWRAGA